MLPIVFGTKDGRVQGSRCSNTADTTHTKSGSGPCASRNVLMALIVNASYQFLANILTFRQTHRLCMKYVYFDGQNPVKETSSLGTSEAVVQLHVWACHFAGTISGSSGKLGLHIWNNAHGL